MRTLILGHGALYNKSWVRCSLLDVDEWFDSPYDSVDNDEQVKPTFLFDLRNKHWTSFATEKYDRIVDTTGLGLSGINSRELNIAVLKKGSEILNVGGTFYLRQHIAVKNTENSFTITDTKSGVTFEVVV